MYMKYPLRLTILLSLVLLQLPAFADSVILDHNHRNWAQLAELSRERHLPVVILVGDEDCAYCELLKRELLLPMARAGRLTNLALLRELSMRTGGKLVDFDGERIRSRIFLSRYKVFVSPTLLFLDSDGHPLHAPLVGYDRTEQYRSRLLKALNDSLAGMHRINEAPGGTIGVQTTAKADTGS